MKNPYKISNYSEAVKRREGILVFDPHAYYMGWKRCEDFLMGATTCFQCKKMEIKTERPDYGPAFCKETGEKIHPNLFSSKPGSEKMWRGCPKFERKNLSWVEDENAEIDELLKDLF